MAQVLFFLDFLMDQFLYFYFFHQFFSLNLLCNATPCAINLFNSNFVVVIFSYY